MRLRLVAGVMLVFLVASLVITGGLLNSHLLLMGTQIGYTQSPAPMAGNLILAENAHQGTSRWQIPPGKEATVQIQAYSGASSILPRQQLTFYVSTQKARIPYSIEIYRLGWYAGTGARLMYSRAGLVGDAQGYYNAVTHQLIDCASCYVDKKTELIEARWRPSFVLTIPYGWTTGVYLAKFIEEGQSRQTYIPFDVRGNNTARYLVGTPDTTYAAYNDWGGASLYGVGNNVRSDERVSVLRAVKVSFDRPYRQGAGASQVLPLEANAIHWLERQGYDLSYISNVDLHKNPRQVFQHRAYLSLGLDEYWTIDMRYSLQRARDFGVGLAFLGADAGYWQMRFEPDQAGMPYRTVVCYRVGTASKDLALDPEYGQDNTRVTTRWRDPLLALPENSLIGVMYSNLTKQQAYISWQVAPTASRSQLLAGTGLQPGRAYGCDLVGPRWDRVFPGPGTPAGLQVLGTSYPRNDYNVRDTSNTTYYIAPSGALVFASGSTSWSNTLDIYRFRPDVACGPQQDVVSALQVLMARIMDALVLHHPLQRLST